jgi:hypothetical protein
MSSFSTESGSIVGLSGIVRIKSYIAIVSPIFIPHDPAVGFAYFDPQGGLLVRDLHMNS